MNDADVLSELLERAAERTKVGPPPMTAMMARAHRARRRRAVMVSAATGVAMIATVGGTWLLSSLHNAGGDTPAQTASAVPTAAMSTPRLPSATASTPAAPTNGTSLEGDWIVRALVGTDGQSLLPKTAAGRVTLTFAHGAMTGTTWCNSVFGTYEQGGTQDQDLRFPHEKLGSTAVGCSEPPLLARLLDVRHVSGSAGVRYLHAENWMIVVELRRAP